jgi:hypothetical protein
MLNIHVLDVIDVQTIVDKYSHSFCHTMFGNQRNVETLAHLVVAVALQNVLQMITTAYFHHKLVGNAWQLV